MIKNKILQTQLYYKKLKRNILYLYKEINVFLFHIFYYILHE